MTARKPPVPIAILAVLYIAVGLIGFIHHFPTSHGPFTAVSSEDLWIELTELLALIAGIFMLLARNWARWLALAWIAFHVILSFFDAYRGLAAHILLFAVIAWLLFRPASNRYFDRIPDA